ncbi:MAG TPA: PhoPQ-activated protein PqaA family protein, partial [Abditibacteriaceae bacterium]|nr:PhoPQ-activated protein PqaA family protein [Abditibacteriaceae bacterium]
MLYREIVKWRAWGAVFLVTTFAGAGCRAEPAATESAQKAVQTAPQIAALDAYIARPEPAYKWEKVTVAPGNNAAGGGFMEALTGGATVSEIKVTSQEWQGIVWTHRVQIFRPAKVKFPGTALLMVSYGRGTPQETLFGKLTANGIGATFINVFNVPNQPLFGKREDDLIAHTFEEYLKTGDATWPLLFPMTKSAVKAMDAANEYSTQEWKQPITKFVVTGSSKRGWTTWLTGAVDKRVIGIIPTVYDNLNLQKQMPHQLETWGKYSAQIEDYTRRGLQAAMTTPRGGQLAAMIDPWFYRDRLTMPKLIVNGTNDPYWTLDSFNLYRDDLKGPTNVLYLPNAEHSLVGQEQNAAVSGAMWFQRVAAGKALPTVKLRLDLAASSVISGHSRPLQVLRFWVTVSEEYGRFGTKGWPRLWVARSATRD